MTTIARAMTGECGRGLPWVRVTPWSARHRGQATLGCISFDTFLMSTEDQSFLELALMLSNLARSVFERDEKVAELALDQASRAIVPLPASSVGPP
jgi:hypothetical protein